MTNHLNLRNTLLEFGEQGNLSIFSDGKSIVLFLSEIQQLLTWLSQEQQVKQLTLASKKFQLDAHGGLYISQGNISIFIPARDTRLIVDWLKQR